MLHPSPDRLFRVRAFDGLAEADLERLASWFEVEEFPEGKRLLREGHADYEFFVLDDGELRVEQDGRGVAMLSPGDIFGEMGMVGDGHREADVIASTDVRVFAMFGTHFRELQAQFPEVARRIDEIAAERRLELNG